MVAPPDNDVLWARALHVKHNGSHALSGVSLGVRDGEILAVGGPRMGTPFGPTAADAARLGGAGEHPLRPLCLASAESGLARQNSLAERERVVWTSPVHGSEFAGMTQPASRPSATGCLVRSSPAYFPRSRAR